MTKIKALNDSDLEQVIGGVGSSKGAKRVKVSREDSNDSTVITGNITRNDPQDRGPYRWR